MLVVAGHDFALEGPLGDYLRAVGDRDSQWPAAMPMPALVASVNNVVPLDTLGLPDDRMRLATPLALYYGFGDERLAGGLGEGTAQRWEQDWWVVVAARHVAQSGGVNLLRDLAGPLRTRVRLALSGWTPDRSTYSPLERQSPGVSPVYMVGYAEFPLRFRTVIRYSSISMRNR